MVIVSAYFKIPSKFSHAFYMDNIRRFLKNIETHIIFFSTPDLVDDLRRMRPAAYPLTLLTYNTIEDIEAYMKYGTEFWARHSQLDNGRNVTTPPLSAVWYNKKEFILRANRVTQEPGPYIWCDAGCIRSDDWFPEALKFGQHLDLVPKDKIMIQILEYVPMEPTLLTWPSCHMAGAIMAGYIETWKKASELYDEILSEYDKKSLPAASDQYVWGACATFEPELFLKVYPITSPDKWFFFLNLL